MLRVGIIGVGTVGASVANILKENSDIIEARCGKKIVPVMGIVRDLHRNRGVDITLSDNIDDVLENDDIDVVIELMGGVNEPFKVVKRALQNGKAVVTANKALLAYHRYKLQDIARSVPLGFEASVAGGIPIIKALREGLGANHIEAIKGIMNGTCNFILTRMMNENVEFKDVLDEAQKLGYAEADPTFDVGGFDAAHKLLILASIAYGIHANPEDILIEGIENINSEDIFFAKEFGYNIKHLTIAKKCANKKVELRAHTALIPSSQMLAKVDDVMNGISVIGDRVGETMYYGAGAGGEATASAVIADLIDIAVGQSSPMLGFKRDLEGGGFTLLSSDEIETKYYMRVKVFDEIGVLTKITSILGDFGISVNSFLQKPDFKDKSCATLLFSTHMSKEINIQNAMKELEKLPACKEKPVMIRIED